MSEDQLNNNLDLVSGRESLELIKTVGTGEFLGQKKKLVSRGSKKNKTISDGGITVDFLIIKVHTSN